MRCMTVSKHLSAFMDKELPNKLNSQISGHLASCSACSAKLEALKDVESDLNTITEIEVSRNFSSNIMNKIKNSESSIRRGTKRFFPTWAPISVAVSIVLVILFNIASFSFALSSQPEKVRSEVAQKVMECFVSSPSILNAKTLLNYCSQCHMALCSGCQTRNNCDMSDCRSK